MKPSEEILQLCRLMNTVPMFIADPLLGTVNPTWVEKLMVRRHQFDDNLSIKENVVNHYGKECAELMERSI